MRSKPTKAMVLWVNLILFGSGLLPAYAENQITVLYDAFGKPSKLKKDWGFSSLVEFNGMRFLFDTGNNADIFAHNLKARGIDLTDLDFAVISHRHGDHIGGLNHLLSVNPEVKIYAPEEGFGVFGFALPGTFYPQNESLSPEQRYFGGNPPETLRFGTAWPDANFSLVSEMTEVAPGVHVFALPGTWGTDPPVVELSLAIDTPEGIVLVVGCSHPTIEKIVQAARTAIGRPIHLVIGGTHLLPASEVDIQNIATTLHKTWRVKWIAPAHCTGEQAFDILKKEFGQHYIYAGLGTTIGFGANQLSELYDPNSRALPTADVLTYRALGALEVHDDHGW